jgi:hypothetical protein
MENRRRITEEDLLITEALIARSYCQLKHSVAQAPSRAFSSASQTARQHPYATAGVAIVTGIAVYGIFKLVTSGTSSHGTAGNSRGFHHEDPGSMDFLQTMLPMILPLVVPYFGSYLQKYLGKIYSQKRD